LTCRETPVLRDLGVSRFELVEADTRLVILARDQSGTILASLELTTGRFYMADDDRGNVEGRRLSVNAFGKTTTHESEGYHPLNLPFPHEALVGAFLIEPVVAAKLSRWGIRIDPNSVPASEQLAPEEEASYFDPGYCASNGGVSSHSSSAYSSSCLISSYGGCDTNGFKKKMFPRSASEWGEYRCCPDLLVFAERACTTPKRMRGLLVQPDRVSRRIRESAMRRRGRRGRLLRRLVLHAVIVRHGWLAARPGGVVEVGLVPARGRNAVVTV
jgi:hypothetical protein